MLACKARCIKIKHFYCDLWLKPLINSPPTHTAYRLMSFFGEDGDHPNS